MKKVLSLRKSLRITVSCLMFVVSLTLISFADDSEKIGWTSILPEDGNISTQQQRVVNSFEATLKEFDLVINNNLQEGKISVDTDFTQNKDVAIVYDYLVYRIYELMKLDAKIREELALLEQSFAKGDESTEAVKRYNIIKRDYEEKGESFFSSLENFKKAILVKDLMVETKNLKNAFGELRSVMNIYSSYHTAIAAR